MFTGNLAVARANFDKGLKRYDPAKHRPLATRFGQDVGLVMFCRRAQALWLLGYPEAANKDNNYAITYAREIGLAASLMFALSVTSDTDVMSRNYATAMAKIDELAGLAEEKGAAFWRGLSLMHRGAVFALIGKASDAARTMPSGISLYRSTGSTLFMPWYSSLLAKAYAELGQLDDARRCIAEAITAIEATKECGARPRSIVSPAKSR